jgi:hypothetical protein
VRRPDDDLRGAEAFSEHYSITERDTAEAAMQDVARWALSQYCSLFSGVADGLDLKYYPRHSTGSAGGVIASPVGEGNPSLSSMVNLAAVLVTPGFGRQTECELCTCQDQNSRTQRLHN